jgi:glycerophosphoryl diester phosphodiesterase
VNPIEMMPLISKFPVLRGSVPFAIAHRGGAWESPENTERAFRHSVELGYSFLETDVRSTKDGIPVVFHDASLDRSTDSHGLIREQTWAEVSKARIHGREEILRLDDLFRLFPTVRFNIDIKEQSAILPFLNTIRRAGAWPRVCV